MASENRGVGFLDLLEQSVGVEYTVYSEKAWQVESLANLVNCLRFAKLKPSKLVVTINNPLADLFICQTISRQMLEKSKFATNILPTKLSCYMVAVIKTSSSTV